MKKFALLSLLAMSMPMFAQTTTTYSVGVKYGNNSCYVSAIYPCTGGLFLDTVNAGMSNVYVRNNPDGTFTNNTVMRYGTDPQGSLNWTSNNFTGTYITLGTVGSAIGLYPIETITGDLTATGLDGSPVTVHIENAKIVCNRHDEGGGRVGIRKVNTYYIQSGTFTETR